MTRQAGQAGLVPVRLAVLLAALFLALATALLPCTVQAEPQAFPVDVRASQITRFRIGDNRTQFGQLKFIGGLELRSSTKAFGSISGFRYTDDGENFLAVTDTGYWIMGRLLHDRDSKPAGLADVLLQPIRGDGERSERDRQYKTDFDAESLELHGNSAFVGFEHHHRISRFRIKDRRPSAEQEQLDYLIPRRELRRNESFEALARAPEDSHLAGALLVITERSLDPQGNIFAAILTGPNKGVFTIEKLGKFAITDGVFLPSGDLLLLERSFSFLEGVRMRLRRMPLADIQAGRLLRGEILFEADMRYQIDNMEAIDSWKDRNGDTRIAILSDDNQSFLQRNLYLEFQLVDN